MNPRICGAALLLTLAGALSAQVNTSFNVAAVPGVAAPVAVPTAAPVLGGMFTITAPPASIAVGPPTVNSITIAALGTGNDATAYSSVALFEDSNNNQVYDQGIDAAYGAAAATFPANDGQLTFTQAHVFAANQVRRYLIVVGFNASAQAAETFQYRVQQVAVVNAPIIGLPSAVMAGLFVNGPVSRFMFVDASPAAAAAWLNSSGNVCQVFTVLYDTAAASQPDKPFSITLGALGTGNESTDITAVQLWWDSDNSGSLNAADTLVDSQTFATDNGQLQFSLASHPLFSPTVLRRYFVAYSLNTQASAAETFKCFLSAAGSPSFGAAIAGLPAPAPAIGTPGLVVGVQTFTVADVGPAAPTQAFAGGTGNVCQAFTVMYQGGQAAKPATVSVTSLGTANEQTDLSAVQLWYDSNASGTFSAADTMVNASAYAADNGTVVFSMASQANFTPSETRRYFVVYDIGASVAHQATFRSFVSGAALPAGMNVIGLPAPAGGSGGLIVTSAPLVAQVLGPAGPITANNTAMGPTGDGELLLDFTLTSASPFTWTVNSLVFAAAGTGDSNSAYSGLALHEDSGNGLWDGTAGDPAAGPAMAFSGGVAQVSLGVGAFTPNAARRFFLVGKLNGTALAGQTFGAALSVVNAAALPGGVQLGVPSAAQIVLQIDGTALVISAGPNQPSAPTHLAGGAATFTLAHLRLHAMNGPVTVSAMSLSGAGTGDWAGDVDSATGVQVYRDDGDGQWGAADTLLFQGGGSAAINAVFGAPLALANNAQTDLWLRLRLTDTAGMGVAATPETFTLAINPAGVSAGAGVNVLLGTPLPASVTVGAIEFRVDSFTPVADRFAGGAAITINGSGFMSPFSVTIGTVACTGTPVISGGTQVIGLTVPAGTGQNLAIVIQSGGLPPQTITATFSYVNIGGGSTSTGPGGCAAGAGSAPVWLAAVAVYLMRRRRANARGCQS